MNRGRFSIKEYFKETFQDERRRKPFLVGLAVFVIVFVGLTLYQQSVEQKQGDVIMQGGDGSGGGANGDGAAGGSGAGQGGDGSGGGANGEGAAGGSGAGQGAGGNGGGGSTNESGAGTGAAGGAGTGTNVIFVDVGGAVQEGGLFALPSGSRVDDAIVAAGGLSEAASMKYINRAALLADGDRLYIPTETEVRDGTAPPTAGQVSASGGSAGAGGSTGASSGGAAEAPNGGGATAGDAAQGLININTAGSEELQKLNGVGPSIAQRIIDHRTKYGAFKRIEELMNVSGIGAKTFEKLKDYIVV